MGHFFFFLSDHVEHSLGQWQSRNCPSASEITLKDMDRSINTKLQQNNIDGIVQDDINSRPLAI